MEFNSNDLLLFFCQFNFHHKCTLSLIRRCSVKTYSPQHWYKIFLAVSPWRCLSKRKARRTSRDRRCTRRFSVGRMKLSARTREDRIWSHPAKTAEEMQKKKNKKKKWTSIIFFCGSTEFLFYIINLYLYFSFISPLPNILDISFYRMAWRPSNSSLCIYRGPDIPCRAL